MAKTIRVKLPDEAHKQAKAAAALQGITFAAWVEAAIVEKLQRLSRKTPAK